MIWRGIRLLWGKLGYGLHTAPQTPPSARTMGGGGKGVSGKTLDYLFRGVKGERAVPIRTGGCCQPSTGTVARAEVATVLNTSSAIPKSPAFASHAF